MGEKSNSAIDRNCVTCAVAVGGNVTATQSGTSLSFTGVTGILVNGTAANNVLEYDSITVALGFSGIYERLASQVGFSGSPNAYRAFVETEAS